MKKKPTHGGKRKGSGRPAKEPTTTIRVPESLVGEIRGLIEMKGHQAVKSKSRVLPQL